MAWGRHAPQTAEAGRTAGETTQGADAEIADRPAHGWEVDEDASWEAVVPDTWDPPASAAGAPGGEHGPAEGPSEEYGPSESDETDESDLDDAPWSDAARSEPEWAGFAMADETVRSPDRAARPAGPAGEDQPDRDQREAQAPQARMTLGLATTAAQRMRGGVPAGDGLVTNVGLLRETMTGLVTLGERVLGPATRIAAGAMKGAVSGAARTAATLPVAGAPVRAAMRSRDMLAELRTARRQGRLLAAAREQGRETLFALVSRIVLESEEDRRPSPSTPDDQGSDDQGGTGRRQ